MLRQYGDEVSKGDLKDITHTAHQLFAEENDEMSCTKVLTYHIKMPCVCDAFNIHIFQFTSRVGAIRIGDVVEDAEDST